MASERQTSGAATAPYRDEKDGRASYDEVWFAAREKDAVCGGNGMAIRLHMLIGTTASGKGRTALELARRCGGEIVSIDSMKVYRRMDIGTAKPSAAARAEVPHHMIDVVEPSEPFSLGRYMEGAQAAIRDIADRGRPIIAVGGTMLYVQGLTRGVFEGPSADDDFRREFRERVRRDGLAALYGELMRVDPAAASKIHTNDQRRIERALEVYQLAGVPISELQTQWENRESPYECRVVGLRREQELESRRINARVKRMIDAGLVNEVRSLLAEPKGLSMQATQAVGYAEIIAHLRGHMSLDGAVERIKINSRRLAKHQRTWMRRMTDIIWVDVSEMDTVGSVAERVMDAWGLKG